VASAESGGRIHQETRLYNPDTGETVGMRSKEDAHDYRYFPEPDLVPLRVGEHWLAEVRATMPELPAVKRKRFIEAIRTERIRRRRAHAVARHRRVLRRVVVGATKDPKTPPTG
jgi:Asp-tRNA(Asn)/Glu-tRNA(Gln) amidotransferase B subunit